MTKVPKTSTPTEEMTAPRRALHKATKKDTFPLWNSVATALNTALILTLFLTDGDARTEFVEQMPVILAWIADNAAMLAVVGTSAGGLVAAFRRSATK